MSNALTVVDTEFTDTHGGAMVRHSGALTPVQSIEDAIALRAQIVEFTRRIMTPDKDFGVIPGTQKPTLLKPGAEKLCTHFGLFDAFEIIAETADWTGAQHGGEPFFAYTVKCLLSRNGEVISEGVGHCNSWEKKYRYRTVYLNKATEEDKQRGKLVTKPGKGGSSYQVYQVPNEDIFDQVNTLLKMAKKRGLIDATLRAVSASEFYTQDIEDSPPAAEIVPVPPTPPIDVHPEPAEQASFTTAELFLQKAQGQGFLYEGNNALRFLAKLLLTHEPKDKKDLASTLSMPDDHWKLCVQQANQEIADAKIPIADPAPVESAQTEMAAA